ncbi:unnamed protein product [Eruca vesicaria subsp. sativa]|uniref:Uncharacterized protein n=1 Tax=Eruca vesicaria subsp. sativa TaxID=29727 RepID=A0ABC8LKW9_ERUVS|nr:unnamed protein product [Eruca vesicaria subsp. sativa]
MRRYRMKISVYDNSEQAVFVLLGDAGLQLTGKHASELAKEDKGVDHVVPVPEALINTIGQTHKLIVKVSEANFTGKTRAITVTKILPKEAPPSLTSSDENSTALASDETLLSANEVCGPSRSVGDSADDEVKRSFDSVEPEKAKRPKPGN